MNSGAKLLVDAEKDNVVRGCCLYYSYRGRGIACRHKRLDSRHLLPKGKGRTAISESTVGPTGAFVSQTDRSSPFSPKAISAEVVTSSAAGRRIRAGIGVGGDDAELLTG